MITDSQTRVTGTRPSVELSALEACAAAALADVAAVLCLMLRFVPLGGLSIVLVAFPFAVLGDRHSVRTCVAATVSGCVTGFLLAGPGTANAVGVAAALGSLVGIANRRAWTWAQTSAVAALILGAPAAAVTITGMWVFAAYRELAFAQVLNSWKGLARIAATTSLTPVTVVIHLGDLALVWVLRYWWAWIPAGVVVSVAIMAAASQLMFHRPLHMVARVVPPNAQRLPEDTGPHPHIDPLPLQLTNVSARYPGATVPTVTQLDFSLNRGEFVAVTGRNGAGKSTLARLIAGTAPQSGDVERPGTAGLGAPGGTAMIFQRPESQVLGVRVVDDLVWGAPTASTVDVDALLARVGLPGMALRETSTLSGGELQRLAIASMLARDPAVVLSDESTAMLDPDGRTQMLRLLRSLAHRERKAVVHITHHRNEIAESDRTVRLEGYTGEPGPFAATPTTPGAGLAARGGVLEVRGLGFAHSRGTPWEHKALTGVDLDVPAGGGLLITGANGSGKSTLAALLSGLRTPTEGFALLDAAPVRNGHNGALLAWQHPRLQLLRATVGEDIRDAAGISATAADEALALLGLSPKLYRDRAIDELSVGEQRRVALAGLLGRRPRLLVLDEPLAGLDHEGRTALLQALTTARESGTTLVMTSHDTHGLANVTDDAVTVEAGQILCPPRPSVPSKTCTTQHGRRGPGPQPAPRPGSPNRPGAGTVLTPRALPWSSFPHRLWAGTKVAVLGLVSVVLAADPTWTTVLAAAGIVGAWSLAAGVPRTIVPRIPRWCLLLGLADLLLVAAGGGAPYITIHGVPLGAGGLIHTARFAAITALTLYGALLFIWTTALTDIPPLLQRIADAGARHRLPLHPWTTTISLGLRLLPILRQECEVVLKMTSQRHDPKPLGRRPALRNSRDQAIRGIVLCCATAIRRSAEMGDAITARGGLGTVAHHDRRPGRYDVAALLGAVAILAAGVLL